MVRSGTVKPPAPRAVALPSDEVLDPPPAPEPVVRKGRGKGVRKSRAKSSMRARQGGPRGNRAEHERERLDDVETAVRRGLAGRQLERELAKQWGIDRRRARDWITKFYAAPGDEAEALRRDLISVARGAIRMALEDGELRPVAALIGQAARLAGIEGPRKVEVTGKDGAPLVPPVDAREELQKALERYAPEVAAEIGQRSTDG